MRSTTPHTPSDRPIKSIRRSTNKPSNRLSIRGRWSRIGSAAVAAAALVLTGLATTGQATAAPATTNATATATATAKSSAGKVTWTRACATPAKGRMACKALRVTGGTTAFQKAEAKADGVTPKAADASTPPATARATSRTRTA